MDDSSEYWHERAEMWSVRALSKSEETIALHDQLFVWKMIALAQTVAIVLAIYWILAR